MSSNNKSNITELKITELKKEVELDKSKSNGLITKIWGPHFWEVLHAVSFGYPLEPTEQNKIDYKEFFISIKNVLPCRYCRESYDEYILKEKDTKLNSSHLSSRDELTKWVYLLHNRVNLKLGMTYDVSYKDVYEKYESYRAICMPKAKSCSMPLHLKANSFRMGELKHAPVIESKILLEFTEYAKLRGVVIDRSILTLQKVPRNDEIWEKRDRLCWKIIKRMRLNGLPIVEPDGIFKNLPTIEELKLFAMMSTNICCDELKEIINLMKKTMNKHCNK
jgi:hypothetical protein